VVLKLKRWTQCFISEYQRWVQFLPDPIINWKTKINMIASPYNGLTMCILVTRVLDIVNYYL